MHPCMVLLSCCDASRLNASLHGAIQLQIMLPNLFLSVSQLIVLLEYFPPEEGYLRVQLIQSVFSHLVDLEQMHRVIDGMLTQDERTELFHRIGIMNLLDPLTPDRLYRLDLRRYDHREWAKILITLAVAEPGENWEQAEYRWGKYDEPVPGRWVKIGSYQAGRQTDRQTDRQTIRLVSTFT